MTLAVGITSFGDRTKIIEVLYRMIGSEEMIQINSYDRDKIISNESSDEEEAYQQVEDELGIDAVRIKKISDTMAFEGMDVDSDMGTARIFYGLDGVRINYLITTTYSESSISLVPDDKYSDSYVYPLDETKVDVREYIIDESQKKKYAGIFEYRHTYYILIATMEKADFELLLKNLKFP